MGNNNKSDFKTRFISSIFIVGYFVIFFIFSFLGNKTWTNIPNKHFFAWTQIVLFLPIVFCGGIEISSIYFLLNKKIKTFFILLLFFSIIPPSIVMILCNYNFISNIDKAFVYSLTFFLIMFICCFIIFFLMVYKKYNFNEILIQIFMFLIFSTFSNGFFYISIVKSWSTLLLIFLIPILNDTCAYLGGRLFGKNKLAPITSPKKTIEGAIIGIISAVGLCMTLLVIYSLSNDKYQMLENFIGIHFKYKVNNLLINNFAKYPLWWVTSLFMMIFLSILSIVGDLSFSAIKRKYKMKDFSNIIPGHGGILDRFDSHTFVYSSFYIISLLIGFFSKTSGVFN